MNHQNEDLSASVPEGWEGPARTKFPPRSPAKSFDSSPLVVTILVLIVLAIAASSLKPVLMQWAEGPTTVECARKAFPEMETLILDRLKAPASAKLHRDKYSVEELANKRVRLHVVLDAQNSFGALLRTTWSCEGFVNEGHTHAFLDKGTLKEHPR